MLVRFRYHLFAALVTVSAATVASAQTPAPAPPAPSETTVVRAGTVVQVDSGALVLAFGTAATALATGIRSAAGVLKTYLVGRDEKEANREAKWEKVLAAVTTIVDRYYTDRGASATALDGVGDELEELRDMVAEVIGKPKRTRRRHKAPAEHKDDEHKADHKDDDENDDTVERSKI
jgi:hypothetical protein